jgi:DNA-binding NtrC family response regulator
MALADAGYVPLAAATADEAISLAAASGRVAAVVIDVHLRAARGTEFAELIDEAAPGVPVVYMSGHDRRTACVASDACFLQKPFALEVLLSSLDMLLRADTREAGSQKRVTEEPQSGDRRT